MFNQDLINEAIAAIHDKRWDNACDWLVLAINDIGDANHPYNTEWSNLAEYVMPNVNREKAYDLHCIMKAVQ